MANVITFTADIEPVEMSPHFITKNQVDSGSPSLSEKDSGHGSNFSLLSFRYPGQDLSDDEFSQEFLSSSRCSSVDLNNTTIFPEISHAASIPLAPPPPPLRQTLHGHISMISLAPPPPPLQHLSPPQVYLTPDINARTFQLQFSFEDHGDCMFCHEGIFSMNEVLITSCCTAMFCKDCAHIADPDDCPNPACREYLPVKAECIVCYKEVNEPKNKRKCCLQVVCKDCTREIIRTSIEDEGKICIQCPNPECKKGIIGRDEALPLISGPTKERYERIRLREIESNDKKTCPNCCYVTQHKLPSRFKRYRKEDIRIVCSKCQFVWCYKCQSPWHEKLTCKQFSKGDVQFKKWRKSKNGISANCQMCPLCRVYIQRSEGCDNMTCNRCKTHFCYKCGGFYHFGLPGLGNHSSPTSVWGCTNIYKRNNPMQRKAVRGGYLGAKLAMLTGYPVLFVAGVAIVVIVGAIALPIYGGYRYYKYKKTTNRLYRRHRHQY